MVVDIQPERIEPGKPQQNGRHERFHLTLKQETASPPARTPRLQQRAFDAFLEEYNQERPHEALDNKTPATLYEPSLRPFPRKVPSINYPKDYQVRMVSKDGTICWKSQELYLCEALAKQPVGLEAILRSTLRHPL